VELKLGDCGGIAEYVVEGFRGALGSGRLEYAGFGLGDCTMLGLRRKTKVKIS
jgi:hypothetical protein